MAWRFAALSCLLAACSSASAPDLPRPEPEVCQLAHAIERVLGWSGYVVDCGALMRAAPSSEWQRAQACVLAAQAAGIAYKLSYELPSYDSLDSAGIAARGGPHRALLLRRSSVPSAPWRMRSSLHSATCGDLRPPTGCSVSPGELCLECVNQRPAGSLCDEISSLTR